MNIWLRFPCNSVQLDPEGPLLRAWVTWNGETVEVGRDKWKD